MILVSVNLPQFEYDIHSLIKAFYPREDIKVVSEEPLDEMKASAVMYLKIDYLEDTLCMELFTKNSSVQVLQENWLERNKKAAVRNQIKKMIYEIFQEQSRQYLPWGTLTGIRPTKIPMNLLKEGKSDDEILDYMKYTYLISDEKASLSLQIAKTEQEILSKLHYENGYSLYIGIPFCPTTCLYCSFTSYPICSWKSRVNEYLEAMFKEIDFIAEFYKDKILDTVYIGGGTPTTLEAEELEILLSKLKGTFDFSTVQEFTVEAGRADSITREKLEVLKKYGVDRISVNPQTMNNDTLKKIGRQASVEQVLETYQMAREVGFPNINMDLILGLPDEKEADVSHTIDEVVKLNPDSLTVHSLAIKRASKLHEWIEKNGMETLCNTNETMEIASQGARQMDMKPYYLYRQKNMSGNLENVGFAKDGKYGIYNILIMEEKQTIVAIGAGSISKLVLPDGKIERCDSVKDVGLYIEKIDEMIERKRKLLSVK